MLNHTVRQAAEEAHRIAQDVGQSDAAFPSEGVAGANGEAARMPVKRFDDEIRFIAALTDLKDCQLCCPIAEIGQRVQPVQRGEADLNVLPCT